MTAVAIAPHRGAARRVQPLATAIHTSGLSKRYGDRRVVDAVDLEVPVGSIAGFVGPNGAGKTTTIRMLLGLVRPTEGTGEVLGCDITQPHRYLPRVGALIEGPAFHPGLSGRRNLEALAILGGQDRRRVDAVLELVDLADRGGDLYGRYSLGMKQRLGIAAALLPEPQLLVLDEPTNGLDPAGINEVRAMLGRLRDGGTTIFVSSHLLDELERVAGWLVVLHGGRVAFQGEPDVLVARRGASLLVAGETHDDLAVIARVATRLGLSVTLEGTRVRVEDGPAAAARLSRAVVDAGVGLTELTRERATLEETFLDITGGR